MVANRDEHARTRERCTRILIAGGAPEDYRVEEDCAPEETAYWAPPEQAVDHENLSGPPAGELPLWFCAALVWVTVGAFITAVAAALVQEVLR